MRLFLLLFSFLIIGSSAIAQSTTTNNSGSVKGRVFDPDTKEMIPLAQVIIAHLNRGASTDMEGNFEINNIPSGKHEVRISAVGYEDVKLNITIVEGQQLNMDTVKVPSGVVMLNEVQLSSSVISMGDEHQTPMATSTVSAREIQEQMGSGEFPEVLKSTPGIYTSMAGGSLGSGRVTVRGFASENTAVMLNGIPVNDMENGTVFWSNWGGLNDVTRYKQVQRGLGNSKLAISSVGGTINIISKPTEMRRGVGVSYARTNGSYTDRLMVTASTGLVKNWAVTFTGSRRWGNGYRPGTYADSWAYYLSAYRKLGERHQLLFTGFGAPQTTGTALSVTGAQIVQYGYLYNPSWGYYNGQVRNRNMNQFHKPQFMLTHYFDISKKMKLTTNVYTSIGRGGGTSIQRTVGSASLSNSYFYDQNGQFNWDTLYSINEHNNVTSQTDIGQISGPKSEYYLEKRHNDHNWYGILTSLKTDIKENFTVTFGVDGRIYKGRHYATVEDLLGGKYFLDQNQFTGNSDNNTLTPNHAVTVGDVVRYNYSSSVNWLGLFAQTDYSVGKFDIFFTANGSRTSYYRNGLFNPSAYDSTGISGYGKSQTLSFYNCTVKGGINYRITGRHNLFVNAGYFNKAPMFANAFVNPLVSNLVMPNLKNETIKSIEGGYGYKSGKFSGNLNVYYTVRDNYMFTDSYLDPYSGQFLDYLVTGVGAIHKGVEMDVKVKVLRKIDLSGMLSIGDWRWSKDGYATIRNDNTLQVVQYNQKIYIKGLPIGNAAQTVYALRARYQLPFNAYAGLGWNYFNRLYLNYSPAYRTIPVSGIEELNHNSTTNGFNTFDLFAGKNFKLPKFGHNIRLTLNITNLLNRQFIVEGSENPGYPNYYQTGRPRIYNIALTYEF